MNSMLTIGEARFLSRVERAFADAVAPFGLYADRAIGLRAGGVSFQPAIAIMPPQPANPEGDWHMDFEGAVFLTNTSDKVGIPWMLAAKAMTGGASCRFAAIVHTEERWVDLWTRDFDAKPVRPGEWISIDGIEIAVDALYEMPAPIRT